MVSRYRSPSQTQDRCDIFLISFDQLIGDIIAKNPLFVLITGDFNVRSTNWWKIHSNSKLVSLQNSLTENGVHPSNTLNVSIKLNSQNSISKQNMYERLIWDYKIADIQSINWAIDISHWGNSFEGKNLHEQVPFFNKTTLNIFHNYSLNKTILCNDKNPPWFNNEIRKILWKMRYSNSITNRKSQTDYEQLQLISNSLIKTITSSKRKFYCKLSSKLANPSMSSKTYWSILKTFVNGKKFQ